MESTLLAVILIALVFDFTNGFHDTANSIATMVGTRALDPRLAVLYAAILNFLGALAGHEVAATVGKGVIEASASVATLQVVLAGLTGAIVWNLATWYYGLPSSSSHALIGGLVGAAVAQGNTTVFWGGVKDKVLIPSITAPIIGVIGGLIIMGILMRLLQNMNPVTGNRTFRRLQLFSGGWLSFSHGLNDAQKTMGVMMLALIAAGNISASTVNPPLWVKVSAALAMGLGTYAGGWKIIKTLGGKVVKMSPMQGFSASLASAAILTVAERQGFPVSTTHCVTGSILGAGASKRLSSVRWGVAGNIVSAWVITLPCAALAGFISFHVASIHPALLLSIVGIGIGVMRYRMAREAVTAH